MTKQKIAAALLALSLLLGGCGTAKHVSQSAKASLIPTAKPIDLNGRVINIYTPDSSQNGPMVNYNDSVVQPNEEARIKRIEKTYNCKLHYLTSDEIYVTDSSGKMDNSKFIKSLSTADPLADIVLMPEGEAMSFLYSNSNTVPLLSLKPYLGQLNASSGDLWDTKLMKSLAGKSDIKVLVNNSYYNNFFYSDVLFFNKSLMERKGLWASYNLFEMQKNKTWNWDALTTLCKKVTDGNVKGLYFTSQTLDDLLLSNCNGDFNNLSCSFDGNKYVDGLQKPVQRQAITLLDNLNRNRSLLVGNKYVGSGENEYIDSYYPDLAFEQGKVLFDVGQGSRMFQLGQMQDEWGVVALPIGPNSKNYIINSQATSYREPRCSAIIQNAKHPEELIDILRELALPVLPNDQMINLIADQIKLNPQLPTTAEGVIETYRLLSNPDLFLSNMNANYGQTQYPIYISLTKVFNNKLSLESFYSKTLPVFDKKMQEMIDQYVAKASASAAAAKKATPTPAK